MKKRGKSRQNSSITNNIADIVSRYILALLLSLRSLYLFYLVFTPPTIYLSAFLLNIFYSVEISKQFIYINSYAIEIVKACVAGSAYYLLVLLNLTTRGISLKKRIFVFLFTAFSLLVLNVFRIFMLAILKVNDSPFFDATHYFFWYFLSTVFVIGIWLLAVKIFSIREIPIFSDIKYIISLKRKS